MSSYVLLCRHGQHANGVLTTVTKDGESVYPIDAVGQRLREQLETEQARLETAWCADTAEARETLRRLLDALGFRPEDGLTRATDSQGSVISIEMKQDLSPRHAMLAGGLAEELRRLRPGRPYAAELIVGHQPQLSWIADQLLGAHRGRLRRPPPVPIDHAGLVCITLVSGRRKREKLAWAISFDDKEAAEQVREKIRRKMDVAKLLAGALTLGLTVIFGVLFDKNQFDGLGERRWAVLVAAALLLAAAVLYFATMYAYDSLLMPERFWGERKPSSSRFGRGADWLVDRPPSSAAWVLYQNMMRIWRNLFTTASVLVGAGIAMLGYAALRLQPWQVLAIGLPTLLVLTFWVWWSRPVLGSED